MYFFKSTENRVSLKDIYCLKRQGEEVRKKRQEKKKKEQMT